MKKKWKKDLLIILPVKNTVFHKFVVQLSSFYGVEFFSFFSRFSWGIPFFFSFLTRNSKPRKMRHVNGNYIQFAINYKSLANYQIKTSQALNDTSCNYILLIYSSILKAFTN